MKRLIILFLVALTQSAWCQNVTKPENIILVTWDGYRWQEMFNGAQKWLLQSNKFTKHKDSTEVKFWAATSEERRQKLMPFIWSTVAKNGMIVGNRKKGSRMNIANRYKFSYPGYNEIFTGYGDPQVNSNDYPDNPNTNVFDFLLRADTSFRGKIAAFATWDAFPRIINSNRNHIPVFVNIKEENGTASSGGTVYTTWETTIPSTNPYIETDSSTYRFAKEYIIRNHPRIAFIGFDETDHFAHGGNYDAYLSAANMLDAYLADLWSTIQADSFYSGKTTIILTCDHGRGNKRPDMWRHHGKLVLKAHEIWMLAMGPGIKPVGEVSKTKKQYQNQIAQTIAKLLGYTYTDETHPIGKPIDLIIAE